MVIIKNYNTKYSIFTKERKYSDVLNKKNYCYCGVWKQTDFIGKIKIDKEIYKAIKAGIITTAQKKQLKMLIKNQEKTNEINN